MAKQKSTITEKQPQQKTTTVFAPSRPFLFSRENYLILLAGLGLLAIGFLLMSGGHQPPTQFDPNVVYGFTTITLSTIVVLLGFAVVMVSIFWKGRKSS